jgi:hypothetical protein
MTDLAGVTGRIDLLTNADATETVSTPVQVFKLGFHLGETLDDWTQLHT